MDGGPDAPAEEGAPCTQEPMLCSEAADGQAPLSLELLHRGARDGGPCDLVLVAAHVLMLETGFAPQVRTGAPYGVGMRTWSYAAF